MGKSKVIGVLNAGEKKTVEIVGDEGRFYVSETGRRFLKRNYVLGPAPVKPKKKEKEEPEKEPEEVKEDAVQRADLGE